MATNVEIAQYVEAGVETFMGLVFGIWGLWAGGFIASFMGRVSSPRRRWHRYLLYILSLGSFVMGAFMWLTVEGAVDCTTGCRTDGINAEYGRQIGYGVGATAVVIAMAVYGQFTMAAGSVSAICMFLTYVMTFLGTFYGASTNLTWVIFVYWAFFICLGSYNTFVSWGIKPNVFYSNLFAAGLLYLFVILQGLWLILSQQVVGSFSLLTEAGLYAAFGPGMLIFVGVLLGFTYSSTVALWFKKHVKHVPGYPHGHHSVRTSSSHVYFPSPSRSM
jgi:hypothetical protein